MSYRVCAVSVHDRDSYPKCMDPDHLLALLEPMLANFKRELEELRAAGATQSDVERMLDDFEERYAEDEESKLVVEILRQAARSPN